MMKVEEYLGALLAGLSDKTMLPPKEASGLTGLKVEGTSLRPLHSILAEAWKAEGPVTFSGNRLSPENFLPLDINDVNTPLVPPADGFTSELNLLRQLSAGYDKAERYGIYHLVQAYGSRLTAAGNNNPEDVSVFDRNRLLAAVTTCIQHEDYQGKFLFVKGAVSGIQRFIYHQIQAEQAGEAAKVSKRLRGRSFFVAILGDILAEYLIECLGLEQANVLFVGGGHFNLLLPASDGMEDRIAVIIQDINKKMLQQFQLQLGLVHSMVNFEPGELHNFQHVFSKANDALETAKQRRFSGYLAESIFNLTIPSRSTESKLLEEIGQSVPHASFLVEISGERTARKTFADLILKRGRRPLQLKAVDKDYYLVGKSSEGDVWQQLYEWWEEALPVIESNGLPVKLIRLNNTTFLPPANSAKRYIALPISFGFRFIGQHTPRYRVDEGTDKEKGSIMWFEDLAALDKEENKLPYPQLAALRLDVDDLGAMFKYGLGEKTSLARTLSLSREMQLFFGGHLNNVAKDNHTYVVYSGGDDAFVIGSWYNILYFVKRLREDFSRLTGNNQEIGIGAGIFTCHPKYPVARLGYDAGEQEEDAKQYKRNNVVKKDAIRVFGHTMPWNRFKDMMKFAEMLAMHVAPSGQQGEIKRSLLQHLLQVIQSAHAAREAELRVHEWISAEGDEEKPKESDHFEFYRNIGRLHALIKRRGYSGKPGDETKPGGIIDILLRDMSDFELFADYILPLQFVLFKTRS